MTIRKITAADAKDARILKRLGAIEAAAVSYCEKKAQGARLYGDGEILLADSPRRFKLFCETRDILLVKEGAGHFKWARGETDFESGEAFEIAGAGEYEVNGKCVFAVYRCK